MSWAADDWTAGLTGRVLQKVRELQAQQERLGRERQQKQLQLDNAEAALHKHKQKGEEVRAELAVAQRELAGVREQAQGEVRARERLAQDLQARQAQVCSLEGQLEAAHTLTGNLTKEIKRLEAELEKLQRANGSGDSMLFSTPCWNMASPWEHNSSKLDERAGHRGEGEGRLAHVRQQLQFSDSPRSASSGAPSPFPQQPHKATPGRRSARNPDASTPTAVFPWERDDTRSVPRGRTASSAAPSGELITGAQDAPGDCGMEEDLRKERDAQTLKIQELKTWVQSLEKDLRTEAERLKESEARLGEAKRELAGREQSLMRTKDELGRAHTLIGQERDRAQASDQRAKQLQEELKCQRQNAETCRSNAEQKRKEVEREHQRELLELQKERQALERQHQQESHKLNQEIQQARALHHTLQSQHDKLGLQKQAVEQELDFIKGKLKGTEAELQDTQKREAQTQAKLTEALRDSESLTVTVEQLKRKERSLEEEVKRLSEELADALRRLKELQDQPPAPAAVVTPPQHSSCGDGFNPAVSYDRPGPHQTQTHKKKALRVDRTKEEAIQRAKYPSDREPGEGIDSEQIKEFGSEQPAKGRRKKGRRGKTGWRDEGSDQTDEAGEILSSALEEEEEDASCDEGETNQLCPKSQLTEALISSSRSSAECSRSKPTPSSPSRSPSRGGGGAQTTDLKRENVALRDELRDTKQELERRLDDLESQRRAEAEARTKLKQLSRKHSTQTEQLRHKAQEQQEERQRLERQLEEARRDAGRLEEALAAAEGRLEESREERDAEAAGERSECERLREALTEMERKGREMEEESGRLKEDLEALRVELTQEREDREKSREEDEEEEELQGKEEGAGKEDLLAKVAELEAELDELRKAPKENLQLKYLQLNGSCDDNKAMVFNNEDIIPSPIDHVSFCQAVNLQNSMVSQEASTKNFITDLGACKKLAEHSRNEKEVRSAGLAQEVDRLKVECESLRGERDRESGRVKATQNRLEALQKQVTSQTQQLTRAFESQSSHIEGLLLELQQRDAALQRQGEELRLCQEEMAQVRAAKEKLETEVRTEAPQIDSSDEAKEVSVHPDATVDKNQPEAHCDTIDNTKAKTLDREVDVLSVKDVSNTSTPVEPQSGEQHKAGAQSNTSNVPLQTADTNAQDVSATDVQSGSLPCEIATSGNPVAFVEGSGNLNEKRSVHTQTTVQESSGEVPLDAGDPRHGGPATALASGQPERSHNSTLQRSPADVLALDASTMTEAAEESPEIQGEVDLLRAQNAQLAQKLKEASVEELQSVRVENEKLKSRLKQLETASVHVQEDVPAGREDDGASRLCPEGQGDLFVQTPDAENTEERVPPVQPVSGQPEATTVTETTVERSAEKESVGEDTFSHSDDASHQQQLQALLVELRRLTGENESQAEELELWRTAASQEPSALLPGATAGRRGDGEGILVVRREDHILLSCGADKLSGQLLETRSMIHHQSEEAGGHPSTTTPTTTQQQDSPAPPKVEVDHGASVKSLESKAGELIDEVSSCHEVETETKDSRRSAEDLRSETRSSDRGGYNTKANLCGSPTETKIVTGHTDQDHELAGHCAPAPHAKANSVSCTTDQVQSSKETSGDAAARTKADDSGPETALVQTPTREPLRAPARPAELGVRTASVTPGGTSPAETHRHGAEEKLRVPEASSRDGAEGQSSEVTGVERAEVIRREVRSAATQTEEETHAQSPENTPQRAALLDAGTQTDGGPEEEEEEDEEEEDEVTDSPCPSPGATAESERLLLSGAFPIPANPAHLAERIRRNRNRMSAAYDDTEYEPYGLPEVVMKGFADIPSGPACPYVLRRGLLGTPAVPLPAREEEGDTDP